MNHVCFLHAQRALSDLLGSVDRTCQLPAQPSNWLSSLGAWGEWGESEKTAAWGKAIQKPNPVAKWICETGGIGFQSLEGPWRSSSLTPLTTSTPRDLPNATQPYSGRVGNKTWFSRTFMLVSLEFLPSRGQFDISLSSLIRHCCLERNEIVSLD